MKLIIGKNSKIVSSIRDSLIGCDLIGYDEISKTSFDHYSVLYLFSWDNKSLVGIYELISKLPCYKLIFISSASVYSNQCRLQWAVYPNLKSTIEDAVLARGGKVLRIGSVNNDFFVHMPRSAAFTSETSLIKFINQSEYSEIENTVDLFTVRRGELGSAQFYLSELFSRISSLLPSKTIFQIPIAGLLKLMGNYNYSYNRDSNLYFREIVQVGYGAIGSRYLKHPSSDTFYLVSPLRDKTILNNGFSLFKIGYYNTGLSKYWHGVKSWTTKIRFSDHFEFSKSHVLKFVRRPYPPPNSSAFCHVINIHWDGQIWHLTGITPSGKTNKYFCNKLILAAGAIENIKLLSSITGEINVNLDDDENRFIGTLDTSEVVDKRIVGKFLFIMYKRFGLYNRESNYMLEFRPFVKSKSGVDSGIAFYLANTSSILVKIIKGFSFDRLNEAFYNKFGVAIATRRLSIFAQALCKDAVEITAKDGALIELHRNRLKNYYWGVMDSHIQNEFDSFIPTKNNVSIDGLHLGGGQEILSNPIVKSLINNSVLLIAGPPNKNRLDPFHTTRLYQDAVS